MLADWPQSHFNFKQTDVRQMVAMLDEAIADLRVASGAQRFDLTLSAFAEVPGISEPLLPPHIALQNPELLGGYPFYVFPRLGKILVMIDRDGDENLPGFLFSNG